LLFPFNAKTAEEALINLRHAVDRDEEAVTEDANQIALLKAEIEKLKGQHGKEIEALQVDIKNLAELLFWLGYVGAVMERFSQLRLLRRFPEKPNE
jgi:uncharacterized small protein (DUF1192 family)